MMTGVPYLPEKRIERDAAALLAEFEQVRRVQINPPVPIDDIIEKHLKLSLEFDDMYQLLGIPRCPFLIEPDILGALYSDERRIVIDEYLDPEENPSREGRYRFTLAHEAGHWRLHRDLFVNDQMQISMFDKPAAPAMICRSSQARGRLEWQADFYASCLLMPQKLLMAAWNEMFPDDKPRVIQPCIPIDHPFVEVPRLECETDDLDGSEAEDWVLDSLARPLAAQFLVSPIAMRIRLEKLGLLYRHVPIRAL